MSLGTEQAQQRRLAGAVRAEHGPVLSLADRERDRSEETAPLGRPHRCAV